MAKGRDADKTGGEQLIEAIRAKELARVNALIAGGADVNEAPEEESPIGAAAEIGDERIVDVLLKAGADPGVGGIYVPICRAVAHGHANILRKLLDAGAYVDEPEEDETTALMIAAAVGRLDLVKMLIAARADPRAVDSEGNSAVMHAKGHADVIEFLAPLSREEDVEAARGTSRPLASTSLLEAAEKGDLKSVDALLAGGREDVNAKDQYGRTPLWHAVSMRHLKVVERLLKAGVKVEVPDAFGQTPFLRAVGKDPEKRKLLKMLAGAGANVRAKDKSGQDALTLAAYDLMDRSDDAAALRATFIEIGLISEAGGAIADAAARGDVDAVREALDAGTSPDAMDDQDRTPLYLAVSRRRPEVVALLIKAGADVNKPIGRDDDAPGIFGGPATGRVPVLTYAPGYTPLLAAARLGDVATAKRLLDAGAKVDAGPGGLTPLMAACSCGHVATAKLLIERNANVNAVCKDTGSRVTTKLTAVQIAAEAGNVELLDVLWEAGAKADDKNAITIVAAARSGDVKRIKALIAAGAKPDAVDPFTGHTPVFAAAGAGHADAVKALLAAGAPTTPPRKGAASPLLMACASISEGLQRDEKTPDDVPRYVQTVKYLIDAGAPVKVASWGQTPLGLAKAAKCKPLIEILESALAAERPAPKPKPKK